MRVNFLPRELVLGPPRRILYPLFVRSHRLATALILGLPLRFSYATEYHNFSQ